MASKNAKNFVTNKLKGDFCELFFSRKYIYTPQYSIYKR